MSLTKLVSPALFAASALVSLSLAAPVSANGLSNLHSKVKVGGRLCFATHEHTGYAKTRGSKRATAAAAVRDWSSFTKLEYGSRWANYRRAHGRRISCQRSGATWSCKAVAKPCR